MADTPLDNNAPVAPLAPLTPPEPAPPPKKAAPDAAESAAPPEKPARQPTDVRLRYIGKDGAHTVWGEHPLPAADIEHQHLRYFGLTRKADRAAVVATGLYEDTDVSGADEE